MRKQLLIGMMLAVFMLTSISVMAQSEFSFDATKWTCSNGAITTDGGVITCTAHQWSCTDVTTNTSFKVKTTGRYLVITGTNIYDGTNNPKIKTFNGADASLKLTVNETNTKAYVDMSSLYSQLAAEGDYYTINGIGFFIQSDAESDYGNTAFTTPTVITNIEFTPTKPVDPIAYTFDATTWASTVGGISTADNKITCTGYAWGCFGIKNETVYKVKKTDNYIIVKGSNLYSGTNNPCLCLLNEELGAKPKLTVNTSNTMAYINIASYTESLEADADGYITISGIGFYLQEGNEFSVVSDIYFASSVPVDADPFTFVPTQWSSTLGSITTANNQIDCTGYAWGCTGIKTSTPFKIKKTDSVYLILTGTNIYSGSNPCIFNFNAADYDWRPPFTVSDDNTTAYRDITGYISGLEADAEGYVTVMSLGLYIQAEADGTYTEEGHPVITNIEFKDTVPTGIQSITADSNSATRKKIYNLAGQRVTAPNKGIYIIDGKKVAIK